MSIHSFLTNCQEGKEAEVRGSLNRGEVGVNSTDDNGLTAAQVAAANDQTNVLRLLLEFKADFNQENHVGWTPLHQACVHGHEESARFLLAQGCDPGARNRYGASALTLAAAAGHLSTVRLLLDTGMKVDDQLPAEYKTCPSASMVAAMYSNQSLLQLLVNRGAKIDSIVSPARWTALMFSAADGHKLNCQLLLDRSADPNKVNLLEQTALDIATLSGLSEDVCSYLRERTDTQNLDEVKDVQDAELIQAARDGDEERVKVVLDDLEVSLDVEDQEGATPLILAAIGGFTNIVQLLIDGGADLNKQDRLNKWTALMQATFFCHLNIVKLLIHHKANPTLVGSNGCTALDLATLVDDEDGGLVRLIAEYTVTCHPPVDHLDPDNRPGKPRIAFENRSHSVMDLDRLRGESGLKGFWNKVFRGFQTMTRPLNLKRPDSNHLQVENTNGLGIQALIPPAPSFVPGFTKNSSFASLMTSTQTRTEVPFFRPHVHETTLSSSKFGMPVGHPDETCSFPDSRRLLPSTRKSSNNKFSHGKPSSSRGGKSSRVSSTSTTSRTPALTDDKDQGRRKSRSRSRRKKSKIDPSDEMTTASVLKQLGLSHLQRKFDDQEVDFPVLLTLDDQDLTEVGVTSPEDRHRILDLISKYS